jgi:hypothetical protein
VTVNAELANSARWLAAKVRQTPALTDARAESYWRELEHELKNCRSAGAKELAIIEWRERMDERLAAHLLHARLQEVGK